MKDDRETEDYEVGYGKPPKSGQFKKGASGNPLGRPNKSSDFGKELIRELNLPQVINVGGKRSVMKKHQAFVKQLVNKSLSGHHSSIRLLIPLYQEALQKEAEEKQRATARSKRTADELSDDELAQIIFDEREKRARIEQTAILPLD